MNKLLDLFTGLMGKIALLAWFVGGLAGVIYWGFFSNLSYAILSFMVPFFGAVTIVLDLMDK